MRSEFVRIYDLAGLKGFAQELAAILRAGDRLLLNGPMGSGKSTLARLLLQSLGIQQDFAGSPSFPLAHEYTLGEQIIAHIDFYRLRSEQELFEAGLEECFFDPKKIVLAEWTELFPNFHQKLLKHSQGQRNLWVWMDFPPDQPKMRSLKFQLSS